MSHRNLGTAGINILAVLNQPTPLEQAKQQATQLGIYEQTLSPEDRRQLKCALIAREYCHGIELPTKETQC